MINKLLTKCLFYSAGPNALCENRNIESLKNHFVKSYCRFEKIPKSDPLTAWYLFFIFNTIYFCSNEIGTKSIPPLDRLSSLFKGKQYSSLNPEEELPVKSKRNALNTYN